MRVEAKRQTIHPHTHTHTHRCREEKEKGEEWEREREERLQQHEPPLHFTATATDAPPKTIPILKNESPIRSREEMKAM